MGGRAGRAGHTRWPPARRASRSPGGPHRGVARRQDVFTRACIERTRQRVLEGLLEAGCTEDAERLAAQHDLDAQRDAAFAIAASGLAFAGYLFDAIRRRPSPGLCAYIAANAAASRDGRRGHDEERATQVHSLTEHLGLTRDH